MQNNALIQNPAEIARLIRKSMEHTALPFTVIQTCKSPLCDLKSDRDKAINFPCEVHIPNSNCHLEIPWIGQCGANRQPSLLYLRKPAQESSIGTVGDILDVVPYAIGLHQLQAFEKHLIYLDPRSKQTGNPGLQVTQITNGFGWSLINRDSDRKIYLRLIRTRPEKKDPFLPDMPEVENEWMLTSEDIWNNNYMLKMQAGESPERMEIIAKTLLTMACKKLHLQIVEPFDPFEL